jgi:hypothetical protein
LFKHSKPGIVSDHVGKWVLYIIGLLRI